MNKSDIEFLKQLQHELLTQPTDGNADPRIWGIGVEDRIYGMESEASDGYVIVNDGETVLENCYEQELIRYLAETHEIDPEKFGPYDSVEDILEAVSEELNGWPIYISYYKTIHTVCRRPRFSDEEGSAGAYPQIRVQLLQAAHLCDDGGQMPGIRESAADPEGYRLGIPGGVRMSLNTADIVFYEESQRCQKPEKEYRICFVDGHSLQYREFTTTAQSRDDAIQKMGVYYDLAFDHRFIAIYEDGIMIYEEE